MTCAFDPVWRILNEKWQTNIIAEKQHENLEFSSRKYFFIWSSSSWWVIFVVIFKNTKDIAFNVRISHFKIKYSNRSVYVNWRGNRYCTNKVGVVEPIYNKTFWKMKMGSINFCKRYESFNRFIILICVIKSCNYMKNKCRIN